MWILDGSQAWRQVSRTKDKSFLCAQGRLCVDECACAELSLLQYPVAPKNSLCGCVPKCLRMRIQTKNLAPMDCLFLKGEKRNRNIIWASVSTSVVVRVCVPANVSPSAIVNPSVSFGWECIRVQLLHEWSVTRNVLCITFEALGVQTFQSVVIKILTF